MDSVDLKIVFTPSKLFPLAEAAGMEVFTFARKAIEKICELSGGAWEKTINFGAKNPTIMIRKAVREQVEANWKLIEQICNPELQTT